MAKERVFIGIHCGASVDGVDLCAVQLTGRLARGRAQQLASGYVPLSGELRAALRELLAAAMVKPDALARADAELSAAMADALQGWLRENAIAGEQVTVAALAGPVLAAWPGQGGRPGMVLSVGGGDAAARRVGVSVVDGFAASDAALGGRGVGETCWPAWKLLHDRRLSRVLVHLGGLVTLTFLGGGRSEERRVGKEGRVRWWPE